MEKQELREQVWDELDESGEARFPFPPHGRIPNYAGAEQAADRLAELDVWQKADVIKSNPDSPQLPVRRRALEAGKTVYMAVPRLRDEECFLELDPAAIEDTDAAATVSAMDEYGRQAAPGAVATVDLIVAGSVAVNESGARIGKGEGFSDLEYALLRECGIVDATAPVVTPDHERQVREETWAVDAHDVPIDYLVTPERTVETDTPHERPVGVDWDALSEERVAEMPVLAARKP
jgi:5-formyltetrahydrofolate cyclo-ligase